MTRPLHLLYCFDSGLTVSLARVEAKKLLSRHEAVTMVEALNRIAMREMGLNWSQAMDKLKEVHDRKHEQKNNIKPIKEAKTATQTANQTQAKLQNKSKKIQPKKNKHKTKPNQYEPLNKRITFHMTLSDISQLLAQYPQIGSTGVLPENMSVTEKQAERDALLASVNACNLACYFINHCQTNKHVNLKLDIKKLTAYANLYLTKKGILDNHSEINASNSNASNAKANDIKVNKTAVSEGALILAGIYHGLIFKFLPNTVYFNISARTAIFKGLQ